MTQRLLHVERLAKRYGRLPVLDGLSFHVRGGERVALLGPSGCGKTTLFRILLGFEPCDAGRIERRYASAGYLPQGGLLFPWKTVWENIELPLVLNQINREERKRRIQKWVQPFGLGGFEHLYPHALSGGMTQRAALLRTLMTEAPILLLDEPFGALDTITRGRLQDWLADLLDDIEGTLLFVTHDLEEAVLLSQRVLVLTDRPTHVLEEIPLHFESERARRNRLGSAFLLYKAKIARLIEEGGGKNGGLHEPI